MNPASEVLLSIATELANMAKASLPKLNDGEKVQREWLEDGIYCRETTFEGEIVRCQYDFRQRKIRRIAARICDCID